LRAHLAVCRDAARVIVCRARNEARSQAFQETVCLLRNLAVDTFRAMDRKAIVFRWRDLHESHPLTMLLWPPMVKPLRRHTLDLS
jgi:hypothetical protein